MDGLALLGLILILYAVVVVVLAVRKPESIWKMGKIQLFIKMLGDKGTVALFYVIAAVALGFGVWLLVR